MKVKRKRGKIGRIKMMGRQKQELVIPQELQIRKIIQPTHGIITIKSVKIKRASNERVAAKQNLRAVTGCSIKRVSNEKVAVNREQVRMAANQK